MLARLVLASLLLEIAAWVAVGTWLRSATGWPPAIVACTIVAAVFTARLGFLLSSCTLAWLWRSPREPGERIGLAASLACIAREYRAIVLDNFWYLPFRHFAVRPDPPLEPSALTPMLLVHGYFSNRGYFRPLVGALEADARIGPIFTHDYPVVGAAIERFATELHGEIERVVAGCACAKVILVCHSMGGLAAREYLREHGAGRIERLVTIASPHHGTVVSTFGIGPNAKQMRPGSDFLARLASAEAASTPAIPALSIYSPHDNLVSPQRTSRLEWARNVSLPGSGHVSLIGDPRTIAAVIAEIAG